VYIFIIVILIKRYEVIVKLLSEKSEKRYIFTLICYIFYKFKTKELLSRLLIAIANPCENLLETNCSVVNIFRARFLCRKYRLRGKSFDANKKCKKYTHERILCATICLHVGIDLFLQRHYS